MDIFLLIVAAALIGVGAYFMAVYFMKLPSLRLPRVNKNDLNAVVMKIVKWVAGFVRLDQYGRQRLQVVLNAADMYLSPEMYISRAVVYAAGVLLLLIPALLVFPLLAIIVVLLAVAVFFKEYRSAIDIYERKKREIESDLLRFAASVKESLKNHRNVLDLLVSFRLSANREFARELGVTITDMRTGNYETALARLSARVNSSMLSDIVRGLLGTLRGDDQTYYFETLVQKFKEREVSRLKKEVLKNPSKVKVFSFMMVVCFILIYMVVMGIEVLKTVGGMF